MTAIELRRASGYLFVFAPPLLLAIGAGLQMPWLAFVGLIVVAPFLRVVFGDAPDQQPQWSEPVALALEALPIAAAVSYFAAVALLMWTLASSDSPLGGLLWHGLSLWASMVFASCVAHELLHRRAQRSRLVGRLLSGLQGYPLLEHEHRAHHAWSGSSRVPEWPRADESVWAFTARRWKHAAAGAWEGDAVAAMRKGHRLAGGLAVSVAAWVATVGGFWFVAGFGSAVMYCVVTLVVAWSMHAITYVQHWGLGEDSIDDAESGDYGWEDRCQLQAWLTLSISFHQAHHHGNNVPYYRQTPEGGSPRQPGGYVVLLLASMVPAVWQRLMRPALEQWRSNPDSQPTPGRRLVCIARQER